MECLNNGGTVVAPVFSLGRSQEILYELKCMQDEGSLDPNIPIYFDGKLAIRYTLLYIRDGLDIKESMKEFMPRNTQYVDKTNRCDVLASTETKIILTTSGMGSYGPAQVYIPEYLTRKMSLSILRGILQKELLEIDLKKQKLENLCRLEEPL